MDENRTSYYSFVTRDDGSRVLTFLPTDRDERATEIEPTTRTCGMWCFDRRNRKSQWIPHEGIIFLKVLWDELSPAPSKLSVRVCKGVVLGFSWLFLWTTLWIPALIMAAHDVRQGALQYTIVYSLLHRQKKIDPETYHHGLFTKQVSSGINFTIFPQEQSGIKQFVD